jgi:hypothetical protein
MHLTLSHLAPHLYDPETDSPFVIAFQQTVPSHTQMPNPINEHALLQRSGEGEGIEEFSTYCGNTIAKMFPDCGRVIGKWGTTLQKKLDEDKLRDKPWNTSLWACFDPFDLCTFTKLRQWLVLG